MNSKRIFSISTVLLLAGAASCLRADVVFSDIDTSSYDPSQAIILSGTAVAAAFTPNTNYTLTQVGVDIQDILFTGGGVVDLSLVADNGGQPTGPALESWTLSGLPYDGNCSPCQPGGRNHSAVVGRHTAPPERSGKGLVS